MESCDRNESFWGAFLSRFHKGILQPHLKRGGNVAPFLFAQ